MCGFCGLCVPKAVVGHITFYHDVTSIRAYIIFVTSRTNVLVYIQSYVDTFVYVSLGGHNLGTLIMVGS